MKKKKKQLLPPHRRPTMIHHPTLHADFAPFTGWLVEPEQQNGEYFWIDFAENQLATHGREHHYDPLAVGTWEVEDRKTSLYYDLLMCVARVYPGETRHETAKRYIMQAEASSGFCSEKETTP